jgi:hypothetical protein
MLIERNFHLCQDPEYPCFVKNFKQRYDASDDTGLLSNEHLKEWLQDDSQITNL